MIKAILFDMDGVLIDSHDAWFDRFNAALEHFGFKKITVEEFTINFAETAAKYFPGKTVEEIREYYFSTFEKFTAKIKKIKNVDEILDYLRNKGLKIALVSNTQSNIVENILNKFKIRKYFDLIVGGEKVKHGKPNPEIILVACKELKLKPKETILVGDTIYDKQAAEAAGSGFIGYNVDCDKRIDDLIDINKMV
ncbi:MAG: hypothetical protein US54_C0079G0008 [Candidatus Roizmanbacteria bacterium GW2011_GWA2_37_7]|uniref:HAD-superfamily hydrolase, subfamily IA, variant 3 n=1 Tax=Candidatus Roizmanbacteria bacterium GW2011_GWA2_37_7 TaxID=1618481 RepID=A0A0G0H1Y0_9BACT|nr:MAG: hypothetical protein US54_C0079G0008 [Candidatus Roizmanbacteria bacterium GW2011_GWA2_37_7]